jgi:hypothetical protein
MKTITINVSEPVYRVFQKYAEAQDRTTSELIREAMALYKAEKIEKKSSIRHSQPFSVGKVLDPVFKREDYLEEMLYENRD